MPTIRLSVPRKNRVQCEYLRNGEVEWIETVTPGKASDVKQLAGKLGMQYKDALHLLLQNNGETEIPDPEEKPRMTMRVRNLTSKDAVRVKDFEEALATDGEVIEWDDREELCCLDVDYHGSTPPAAEWLLATVQRIKPQPTLYWLSRGGGLHLMYSKIEHVGADELAAVAGLSFLHFDRVATIELLKNTRKPPGDVYVGNPSSDLGAVARLFGSTVADDTVREYLDSLGLEMGQRYPHDRCPIRPCPSHGEPLFVGDAGLVCQKCRASGVVYGSRDPGFFPYTALCGGGASSIIRTMVQHFTHWEQAAPILEQKVGLRGDVAQLAWKGALHLAHGDDPRVARAFSAGVNLLRQDCRWTTREGLYTYTKDVTPIVAELPAVQDISGAPIPSMVARFMQPIDLTELGYPAVCTIPGVRLYSHFLPFDDERVAIVKPSGVLKEPVNEGRRPKYDKTMPIADAWAAIEEVVPGVNREYVQLLIAAKGVTEGAIGMPPLIMVGGPSGAGKTNTVALAAAICGDTHDMLSWTKDTQRFQQAFQSSAERNGFISINEIMKDADRAGSTSLSAMDVFLSLTPESLVHKLYVGAVPIGRIPVTVVTDIEVPQSVRDDLQVSRRFVYVRLGRKVQWQPTVVEKIGRFERLRLSDDRYMIASNAIIADTIDRFFTRKMTLDEIAGELGFSTLDKADGFADPIEMLKRFYDTVELTSDSTDRRWAGGWKVLRRYDESPLADVWDALCDGEGPRWFTSRKIAEQDWANLLGKAVKPEIRRQGDTLGVRFAATT